MHHDELKAAIALQAGITLYQRYNEMEAAKFLDMSVPTLKRRRGAGQISYVKLGQRMISYWGFQLVEYLLDSIEAKVEVRQEQAQWQNTETTKSDTKSVTTGLASRKGAQHGAAHGSTQSLTRQDALASARRILQRPSKP